MKKKNLITTVASVALVGVIAVGSTLAYLSATDGKLTNSFDFVAGGISIDLWEYNGTQDLGKGTSDPVEYTYNNVVAGQKLTKDVNADVKTSVDAYVFIKLQETGDGAGLLESAVVKDGWIKYEQTPGVAGVYYRTVDVTTQGTEQEFTLDIFDEVTVPTTVSEADASLKNIVISTAAIQTEGLTAQQAYAEISSQL